MNTEELRSECLEETCDEGDCWVHDAANEVDRLRAERDSATGYGISQRERAQEAEATIARVREECDMEAARGSDVMSLHRVLRAIDGSTE